MIFAWKSKAASVIITIPTAMFVCNGIHSEYMGFLSKAIYVNYAAKYEWKNPLRYYNLILGTCT